VNSTAAAAAAMHAFLNREPSDAQSIALTIYSPIAFTTYTRPLHYITYPPIALIYTPAHYIYTLYYIYPPIAFTNYPPIAFTIHPPIAFTNYPPIALTIYPPLAFTIYPPSYNNRAGPRLLAAQQQQYQQQKAMQMAAARNKGGMPH